MTTSTTTTGANALENGPQLPLLVEILPAFEALLRLPVGRAQSCAKHVNYALKFSN